MDCKRSFVVSESSKEKSQQWSKEKLTEEEYFTVILDNDEEGDLNLNI